MSSRLPLGLICAVVAACGGASDGKNPESPPGATQTPSETTQAESGSTTDLPPLSGPPRTNKLLQLAVIAAGFDPAGSNAPPGHRYFAVGLRGVARSRSNDVFIEFRPFVFAQNEQGCIARSESNASWLKQPFGDSATFTFAGPTEGQLAFLVPDDTQRVRVLIAPAGGGRLIVPVGDEFTPAWPTPTQTIEDGSTLRVLVLPTPAQLPRLPPPAAGREQVVMDFVIENLSTEQGIEFTTSQQLRLVDQSGKFIQPSAATQQIGCRLDDGDVVPPGHSRRLMVVYDMPPGEPRRLNYRGFEVDEVSVDLN